MERPFDDAAMFAWANLVGTIIETMGAMDMPNHLIRDFLRRLDEANETVLREPARTAYLAATAVLADGIASND